MAIGSETTARHFGSGVFSWLLLGEEDIVITSTKHIDRDTVVAVGSKQSDITTGTTYM